MKARQAGKPKGRHVDLLTNLLMKVQHDRQPAVPLEECPLGHGRPNIVIPADAGIQPTFLLSILWISHGRV